ncbi:sugar ABC transporter ATP-binding protein [Aureimonas leprariae]|uniref:Sugar ABC transporter ATP-binding protein n=1 Tax=Plantimonas leprariae TaxID=2615207 RepID=A0A7V7PLN6_9HYPH|nr:sugar ABC transporter ATP-binding protein [Aureimonas leprariae]KAB0677243.1 sugar ABC transporter ATP-binding protein [Aureimonas leprariae]
MRGEALLAMTDIARSFGGVRALDGVSLVLRAGEIRALVGENGAGKSTLIKILSGAVPPEAGSIEFDGRSLVGASPAQTLAAGIAVIYQEFAQAPHLSVAENIALGALPLGRFGTVSRARMRRQATDVLKLLNARIDVDRRIATLSVAQRQIVEIARAVARDARLIVLDEPSAVLGEAEIGELFRLMRRLRDERGVAFVYVSHRLDEIFSVCDSVTVLRDGRHIETGPVGDFTRERLIRQMVGRDLHALYPDRDGKAPGDVALEVTGLDRPGVLRDIALTVRRGEIVGLCGLSGAGRSEVLMALAGADREASGTIRVNGREARPRSPGEAIRLGLGLIPEDRKTQGLCLGHSVAFNMSLAALPRMARGGVIDGRRERDRVETLIRQLRIKTPTAAARVGNLSGGNQQKCVLARQLIAKSDILLIDEPTRGVDVGARREIYDLMVKLARDDNAAILMVSSDMPEVIGLCDRIYVMREGRITAELDGPTATEHEIMLHAAQ